MTGQQKQTFIDLNRWADFLEDVPSGNFDMNSWKEGYNSLNINKMDGECGTTACAGGWATVIPQFKRRGLHLEREGQSDEKLIVAFEDANRCHYTHMLAISEFFNIEDDDADWICDPVRYPPSFRKQHVISRIRKIAKKFSPAENTKVLDRWTDLYRMRLA